MLIITAHEAITVVIGSLLQYSKSNKTLVKMLISKQHFFCATVNVNGAGKGVGAFSLKKKKKEIPFL